MQQSMNDLYHALVIFKRKYLFLFSIHVLSVESQKGAITIPRCSIENQKGTIAM